MTGRTCPTSYPNFSVSLDVIQQNSPLLTLPIELIAQILMRLKVQDIGVCGLLCKQCVQILNEDLFWQNLFNRHFPHSMDPVQFNPFKKAYKKQHLLHSNMVNGVYALRTFIGHEDSIGSLVIVGKTLYSSSKDKTIKIWDLNSGICSATLKGHTGMVTSIIIKDEKLYSGSMDKTIKVWDLKRYVCTATFAGHIEGIACLALDDGMLVSGSHDKTIKIWDLSAKTCRATLTGHLSWVTSLVIVDGKLISGSWDRTFKIWDLKTCAFMSSVARHSEGVMCLIIVGDKLFTGAWDGMIKVWDLKPIAYAEEANLELIASPWKNEIKIWDLKTSPCIATLKGNEYWVNTVACAEGKLFVGGSFGEIEVWDLMEGTNTTIFSKPSVGITSFAIAEGKLVVGFVGGTISILDFTENDNAILEELSCQFKNWDKANVCEAFERFSRMPKSARDKIYKELIAILQRDAANDGNGWMSTDLCKLPWHNGTPSQKAQAIMNYLLNQEAKE